jgi:steroid delta-isomerase-like uncharacterized protein
VSEQNKAIVRRFFESVNNRDLDALAQVVSRDIEFHGMEVHGLQELQAKFAEIVGGMPDIVMTIHDLIAEGDRVAVRVTGKGTHTGEFEGMPPTDRSFEAAEMDILRIEEGKIAEVWQLYDQLGFLTQLGLFPQPEPAN